VYFVENQQLFSRREFSIQQSLLVFDIVPIEIPRMGFIPAQKMQCKGCLAYLARTADENHLVSKVLPNM